MSYNEFDHMTTRMQTISSLSYSMNRNPTNWTALELPEELDAKLGTHVKLEDRTPLCPSSSARTPGPKAPSVSNRGVKQRQAH